MRRFPAPWTVEKIAGGLKVLDANGQSLAYVYSRETKDVTRQAPDGLVALAYAADMKLFILIITLGLAAAPAIPVIAAEVPTTKAECEQVGMRWKEKVSTCVPTTKAECEQVGMRWKERANKCFPLHESHTLSYYVLGVIGLGCALAGFIIVCGEWRRSAKYA